MRPHTALFVLFIGCGISFGQAKKEGPSALRDFAQAQPEHPKALAAMELADKLDWDVAQESDTEQAYLAYLEASPGGSWSEEATKRADAKSWATAGQDAKLLRLHLEAYPGGKHQFEGWRALEYMELDLVREIGTLEALIQHFKAFPRNPSSTEVAGAIAKTAWMQLKPLRKRQTPTALRVAELPFAPPAKRMRAERFEELAMLAMLLEQHELALHLTDLLVAYDDKNSTTWNLRAMIHRRLGDSKMEEKELKSAMTQELPLRAAEYNLALLRVRQERFDDARTMLEALVTIESPRSGMRTPGVKTRYKNPDPHFYLTRAALYAAENKPIVWREYQLALERLPRHPLATQVLFIEDVRLDPLFASIRDDERFQGLPALPED